MSNVVPGLKLHDPHSLVVKQKSQFGCTRQELGLAFPTSAPGLGLFVWEMGMRRLACFQHGPTIKWGPCCKRTQCRAEGHTPVILVI